MLPTGKTHDFKPHKTDGFGGNKKISGITSKEHMGEIVRLLGSGAQFGCDFTFKVQEEALGIAHALLLAENFAAGHRIIVILGDNIATHSIRPFVELFAAQKQGARVLLRKVEDPERYGIAALDEIKIIEIEEKPEANKREFAVIGIYMYDENVFYIIRQMPPGFGNTNYTVNTAIFKGIILIFCWLADCSTLEALQYANQIMMAVGNQIIDE